MKTTRKYHDFDEGFKYLVRSKTDKDTRKSFDTEVSRAVKTFINYYIKGDSVATAQIKTRGSYGTIITDMAMIKIYKLTI
jgi:hypothetical protein